MNRMLQNEKKMTLRRTQTTHLLPRSIRRDRKRPFLIVFDSFGSDRISSYRK
jgi:hypothetical protein